MTRSTLNQDRHPAGAGNEAGVLSDENEHSSAVSGHPDPTAKSAECRLAAARLETSRQNETGRGMSYHVQVSTGMFNAAHLYNLSAEDLLTRIVRPWSERREVAIQGQRYDLSRAKVVILEGPHANDADRALNAAWLRLLESGKDVTDTFLQEVPAPDPEELTAGRGDSRTVMVVHGRDDSARLAVFSVLRSLGLRPLEWEQAVKLTGRASPYTKEVVDAAFQAARAVLVLLTPDDEVRLHPELRGEAEEGNETISLQARPNVYIEAGMALATHPDRTVLVELGQLREASDLSGINTVRLSTSPLSIKRLATRLATCGCAVDDSGVDWLNTDVIAGLAALTRRPS